MKIVSPSQLDTSNPGTWPVYYKIICWVVVVGLIAFIYNKFFRQPLVEEQDSHNAKISELKDEYKKLYQYQQDLPKYQERSEALVGVLRSLLEYLPSDDEVPDLIDSVYVSGVDSGIIFDTFKRPETDIKQMYYDIKPVMLKTNTKYANFAQFTGRMSALQRIMNVSDMSIKIADKDPNKLTVESQLQTYVYNEDLDKFLKMDLQQLKQRANGENANVQ
ncbi:MAG: type 4a pilus biogenesis protein PilO [Cardiobacterium sp.]|jgi:fimbrial assembly membrane protein